jgi:hypothetical protein
VICHSTRVILVEMYANIGGDKSVCKGMDFFCVRILEFVEIFHTADNQKILDWRVVLACGIRSIGRTTHPIILAFIKVAVVVHSS